MSLDIQGQGLSLANGGVGLSGIGSGTRTLSVTIGGPVQAAVLYWAGRDNPCPTSGGTCVIPFQPYKDQVLRFDGNLVTGTVIGTEAQPTSAFNNIGYLADVTSIVQAKGTGAVSFSIQDGDVTSNLRDLNGAGLIVIYTDPSDSVVYRIIVSHGLDFAFGTDPTAAARVTTPVTFNHGAATTSRVGEVTTFVGDAVSTRPDLITISNNPSLVNTLNSSDGPEWDTDRTLVNIPAGVAATTVQVVSAPVNQFPDSLLWQVAAFRLPLQAAPTMDEGCTPGFWKNHVAAWAGTGFTAGQTAGSVFNVSAFPTLASRTLLQTLQGGGGSGTLGAARILLRAAVAALLNSAHPNLDYPRTTADVIAAVNAALASNNRNTMLTLATALDNDNQLGCNLR